MYEPSFQPTDGQYLNVSGDYASMVEVLLHNIAEPSLVIQRDTKLLSCAPYYHYATIGTWLLLPCPDSTLS